MDTNFLVELMDQKPSAKSKLKLLNGILYTTTITLAELYKGAYRCSDINKEISKIQKLLSILKLLTIDSNSAKIFGELSAKLKSNRIEDADLFIASIVISNNEVLMTKNLEHFNRVPNLKTETW